MKLHLKAYFTDQSESVKDINYWDNPYEKKFTRFSSLTVQYMLQLCRGLQDASWSFEYGSNSIS